MAGTGPASGRLAAVEQAFRSLPDRYLGVDPGFDTTYLIKLCDLGLAMTAEALLELAKL